MKRLNVKSLLWLLTPGLALIVLAGCGSGGGTGGSPPDAQTRSRMQTLVSSQALSLLINGPQSGMAANAMNGPLVSGPPPSGGQGGGVGPTVGGHPGYALPMVGAFVRHVASAPPMSFRRSARTRNGDDGNSGGSPGGGGTLPPGEEEPRRDFYFDEWLGLWVQVVDSSNKSQFLLFEDEAKQKLAGHITTVWPTDFENFPQVYASDFEFTAGLMAGSHGHYSSVQNADGSGSAIYENAYTASWSSRGESQWSAAGGTSWSNEFTGADGYWMRDEGVFRPDGSGSAKSETSDGWKTDFTYNADGSGHGRIDGPATGLPATITWDIYGNIVIRWADGTEDRIPGWGFGGGEGGDQPVTNVTTSSDSNRRTRR